VSGRPTQEAGTLHLFAALLTRVKFSAQESRQIWDRVSSRYSNPLPPESEQVSLALCEVLLAFGKKGVQTPEATALLKSLAERSSKDGKVQKQALTYYTYLTSGTPVAGANHVP
jgi:hypothetical protein